AVAGAGTPRGRRLREGAGKRDEDAAGDRGVVRGRGADGDADRGRGVRPTVREREAREGLGEPGGDAGGDLGPGAPAIFVERAPIHIGRGVEPTRGAGGGTRAEGTEGDLARVDVVDETREIGVDQREIRERSGLCGERVRHTRSPRAARGGRREDQEREEDREPAAIVPRSEERREGK